MVTQRQEGWKDSLRPGSAVPSCHAQEGDSPQRLREKGRDVFYVTDGRCKT